MSRVTFSYPKQTQATDRSVHRYNTRIAVVVLMTSLAFTWMLSPEHAQAKRGAGAKAAPAAAAAPAPAEAAPADVAQAAPAASSGGTTAKAGTTTYDFEDDLVTGDLVRPDGELLSVRRRGARSSLIRIREHFIPEMLKSVENL